MTPPGPRIVRPEKKHDYVAGQITLKVGGHAYHPGLHVLYGMSGGRKKWADTCRTDVITGKWMPPTGAIPGAAIRLGYHHGGQLALIPLEGGWGQTGAIFGQPIGTGGAMEGRRR